MKEKHPKYSSLQGQRNDATDILGLSALTTARCHTLLYLPLLSACAGAVQWRPAGSGREEVRGFTLHWE
jgi:hypothetical protein